MSLTPLDLAFIAAIFAGILSLVGLWVKFRTLPKEKLAIQRTIGLGIGTYMQNLSKQAAEEEGAGSGSPASGGALSLGGFKITPELLQTGMQLLKMAKEMGFIKGGTLGGGGSGSGL